MKKDVNTQTVINEDIVFLGKATVLTLGMGGDYRERNYPWYHHDF